MSLSVEDIISGKISPQDVVNSVQDEQDLAQILKSIESFEKTQYRETCQNHFMPFVKEVWPEFIEGAHHRVMADVIDGIAAGKIKRVIINMPPRHTKSEFFSYHAPAWLLGKNPALKIIQATHTVELAQSFGRKVRDLVDSKIFQNIFTGTKLSDDSKAAGRWNTNKKGEYFAVGVGGKLAGRGADIMIIDDPIAEQDMMASDVKALMDRQWDWYTSGPRQRLQPGAAIIVVMTRWHKLDLTGRLLKEAAKKGKLDEWTLIEFPMELPSGNPVWPGYWDKDHMAALKQDMPYHKWMGQYQQQPTSEGAALIKREWWKPWPEGKKPPNCHYIIQCWDTALTKKQTSDFNACTTWGIFETTHHDEKGRERTINHIILLGGWRGRVSFPELKIKAVELYKDRHPEDLLIETKANGHALIDELRMMGIPASEHQVNRGKKRGSGQSNDKHLRGSACANIFESGYVWYPADKPWAEEIVDECVDFPNAEHDDYFDTVVMAIERFRKGGFISLITDEDFWEDQKSARPIRAAYY